MTKIFVTCQAYSTTGGFELLHQLVYKLNKIKDNCALIYYHNFDSTKLEHPTPDIYMKYTHGKFVTKIIDNKHNVLILPEVFTNYIDIYKNIKIVVWWLSVDNFHISIENINKGRKFNYIDYKKGKKYRLFKLLNYINIKPDYPFNPFRKKVLLSKRVLLHAYQSEYARNFLETKKLKPILPLSDFLNAAFFQNQNSKNEKDDVILYNPKKGFEITKELIAFMPEYKWIPLENLTPIEMEKLMKKSKIYVDFGNHPGKDRIPREATINGCVVITNKKGSASNYLDVSIDNLYKFQDPIERKEDFKKLVKNIYSNFHSHFVNFDSYRIKIRKEEALFEKELLVFYEFLNKFS
jgi:hypothetical protein